MIKTEMVSYPGCCFVYFCLSKKYKDNRYLIVMYISSEPKFAEPSHGKKKSEPSRTRASQFMSRFLKLTLVINSRN